MDKPAKQANSITSARFRDLAQEIDEREIAWLLREATTCVMDWISEDGSERTERSLSLEEFLMSGTGFASAVDVHHDYLPCANELGESAFICRALYMERALATGKGKAFPSDLIKLWVLLEWAVFVQCRGDPGWMITNGIDELEALRQELSETDHDDLWNAAKNLNYPPALVATVDSYDPKAQPLKQAGELGHPNAYRLLGDMYRQECQGGYTNALGDHEPLNPRALRKAIEYYELAVGKLEELAVGKLHVQAAMQALSGLCELDNRPAEAKRWALESSRLPDSEDPARLGCVREFRTFVRLCHAGGVRGQGSLM